MMPNGVFVFKGDLHDKTDVLLPHVTPGASVVRCECAISPAISRILTVATVEDSAQLTQSL